MASKKLTPQSNNNAQPKGQDEIYNVIPGTHSTKMKVTCSFAKNSLTKLS